MTAKKGEMDKIRLAWIVLLLAAFAVALYFLFVYLEGVRKWPWPQRSPMKIVHFYGSILLFVIFMLGLIYVVVAIITR